MWHSLDEDGNIGVYDVEWPDGLVETNIPASYLEHVISETHENTDHQHENTPINKRKYKK
jgi:hypothetical protein